MDVGVAVDVTIASDVVIEVDGNSCVSSIVGFAFAVVITAVGGVFIDISDAEGVVGPVVGIQVGIVQVTGNIYDLTKSINNTTPPQIPNVFYSFSILRQPQAHIQMLINAFIYNM